MTGVIDPAALGAVGAAPGAGDQPAHRRSGWRPKMVALDIDGTLVDHAGFLPEAVRGAVQLAVLSGAAVVLATGRGWHGTEPIFQMLDLPPGPAVASNGAVLVNYPPLEVIKSVTFDPTEVITRVEEFAPGTLIAVEEIGSGFRLNEPFPEGDLSGELIIESLDQLCSRPVSRVILRDPHRSDEDFIRLAERLGLKGVTYFVGYSAWLDIAPHGVNKATGLADIAESLSIDPEDVIAFGDGRNDIEMLRWAGRGVAIGDAPPEVQAVADVVTATFADGGLVPELHHWFG